MSIRVMKLAWRYSLGGGSEKLALLAMADWCDDDGGSLFPSIRAIAKKIGASESQTRRIIHRLIGHGLLSVIANKNGGPEGQTRQYRLNVQNLYACGQKSIQSTGERKGSTYAPLQSMDAHDGAHVCASPLAPVPANTSITIKEPSVKPSRALVKLEAAKAIASLPLPAWLSREAWEDWITHRTNVNAPLNLRSAQLSIARLDVLRLDGNDVTEVIEQSVRSGKWTDLYAIKQQSVKAKLKDGNFLEQDYCC